MRNFYKFTFILFFSLCAKAQVPTATILSSSSVFCTDVNIFFAAKGGNSGTGYTWSFPANRGASFVSDVHDSSMVCTFASPGIITLSLTTAQGTLSSVTTRTLVVVRSAKASFNASLNGAGFPTELSLTNYASNSARHYWVFNGADKDSSETFVKSYVASGSYTVSQVALGKSGCNDTLSYAFYISDSSGITLPNIFSPNGDGINDVYKPIARGISSMKGWVYNRYGALMTSWDRVNGFWDGYTTSGVECRTGEYFVIIEGTGFDGKSYKLKGTFMLVK